VDSLSLGASTFNRREIGDGDFSASPAFLGSLSKYFLHLTEFTDSQILVPRE
jgi:hypothetical protein